MSSRPPVLDESRLSPAQQAVFDQIRQGPRGIVEGPLRVWLISPELAERAQALGAFCRFHTRLPPRMSELAILVVGAYWRSGFEWHVHAPIAIKAGISAAAVDAIHDGRDPDLRNADEAAVYAFARELVATKAVSGGTYARAVDLLGLESVVDLVGILGYYTLISMTINAFKVPVPPGAVEPFG
jgi:4-carboxymuconolactone decarboxylase